MSNEKPKTPTPAQVKELWDQYPDMGARPIADLLAAEGFKISWRSVARWKKNNFLADDKGKAKRTIAENQHTPAAVKTEIRTELAKLPVAQVAEANQAATDGIDSAVIGGKLTDEDYARIERRITALAAMSPSQLVEAQEKARTVMNIVVMEEATRRAHVLALIPKDTGSFLADAAEAAKSRVAEAPIMPTGDERSGDGAKLVHGREVTLNPVSAAIDRFLMDHA